MTITTIEVQKGNTLWGLAKTHLQSLSNGQSVSPNSIHKFVEEIKAKNNLKDNGQISIGEKITLPQDSIGKIILGIK